jgi:dTDP-4-amino-4,6-dideoxygalactose transaminase
VVCLESTVLPAFHVVHDLVDGIVTYFWTKMIFCARAEPTLMDGKRMINVTRPVLPPLSKYVKYLRKIWQTKWMTNNGEFVRLLEERLRKYLGARNLVLVSNGTSALHIMLRALKLKGEVITTPFTFVATTNVIIWEGLTPVFADIDPDTFNINPQDVQKKITDKTCAILAVHVYGNPCYVDEMKEIADRHHLKLIYDGAHAFGVEYDRKPIANYGDMTALSFHATKVFNTVEGGAIVLKDRKMAENLRLLRDHGVRSEERVVLPGTNAKMNEFQAAMGLCNLERIDESIQRRRRIYECYKKKLKGYVKFQRLVASKYNYAYMPVCFRDLRERDDVYSELVKKRIKPRKYFFPLTTQSDYFKKDGTDLIAKYNLKIAFDISNRVLCLPLYPDLQMRSVNRITRIVKSKTEWKNK